MLNEGLKLKVPQGDIVTNPPTRREIRPDFPNTFDVRLDRSMDSLVSLIENKLSEKSSSLQNIERVYIVYPQKHPKRFPGYQDKNSGVPFILSLLLKYHFPKISWPLADSVVETVSLNRSFDQGSFHALTGKQVYEVYEKKRFCSLFSSQNPFVTSKGECSNPHFIIFDHVVEQGTTAANMMSFLEHNGGEVLAVASHINPTPLVQKDTRSKYPNTHLYGEFSNPLRNTGRLPELAFAFCSSMKGRYEDYETPQKCMEAFEKALNGMGHSVFALTDGECKRLRENVMSGIVRLPALVSLSSTYKHDMSHGL